MAYFAETHNRAPRANGNGNRFAHPVAYRTPADDAPSFSAMYWRDRDVSYIANLAQHDFLARAAKTQQDLRAYDNGDEGALFAASSGVPGNDGASADLLAGHRGGGGSRRNRRGFFSSLRELLWPSTTTATTSLPSDQYASFHTIPRYTPLRFIDRVLAFFHIMDTRHRQGSLTASDIKKVGTDELLSLMQLALSAGERERSSFIARELSSRRVAVDFTARQAPAADDLSDNGLYSQQPQPQWQKSVEGAALKTGFASGQSSAFFGSPPQERPMGLSSRDELRRPPQQAFGRDGFEDLNTSTDFFTAPSRQQQQQQRHHGYMREQRSDDRSVYSGSRGPEESFYEEPRSWHQQQQSNDRGLPSSHSNEESTLIYSDRRQQGGEHFSDGLAPAWGAGAF